MWSVFWSSFTMCSRPLGPNWCNQRRKTVWYFSCTFSVIWGEQKLQQKLTAFTWLASIMSLNLLLTRAQAQISCKDIQGRRYLARTSLGSSDNGKNENLLHLTDYVGSSSLTGFRGVQASATSIASIYVISRDNLPLVLKTLIIHGRSTSIDIPGFIWRWLPYFARGHCPKKHKQFRIFGWWKAGNRKIEK